MTLPVPNLDARRLGALAELVGASQAAFELQRCADLHIQLLLPVEFPWRLAVVDPPPPVLYLLGDPAALAPASVAVVGSRHATPLGRRVAHRLGHELAGAGLAVVSGLARGIDRAVLEGCLAGGGVGGAVLGNGLPAIYPPGHFALAQAIVRQGGFVLSEFPLDAPPLPAHFPRRNRIISGLALAVVVVEATLRSGSLITAEWALRQGREVFAMPGPVEGPQNEGCHRLIQDGASLATGAEDVILGLGAIDRGLDGASGTALRKLLRRAVIGEAPGDTPPPPAGSPEAVVVD